MTSREEAVASYVARVAATSQRRGLDHLLHRSAAGGEETVEQPDAGRAIEAAREGLAEIQKGRTPTPEQSAGVEAIILPNIRPVLDVVNGEFFTEHPLWLKLNEEGNVRSRLLSAVQSVGRIELPGHPRLPYGGTGFVVGPGLIMTNRHVAAIFASGVGDRGVTFKPGHRAGIDFLRELDRPTGPTFAVTRVMMVHPFWDMALLSVDGLPDETPVLTLSLADPRESDELEVAAIGYPAFDTRNDIDVQNDLFRKVFGVKRLQPGTLGARRETDSFGKRVPAVLHNCSTLGGNSGSALVDLGTGAVVALHFAGRYAVTNYGVPAAELARDRRVVDAGVTFACPTQPEDPWNDWWGRDWEATSGRRANGGAPANVASAARSVWSRVEVENGAIHIHIPIHLTVRDGSVTASTVQGAATDGGDEIEKLAIPWHDTDYRSRTGYNEEFLGVRAAMPESADDRVMARALDGSPTLHYQNFSIIMHAKRRMALITASNVTAKPELKEPELGRVYSRRALGGLGKNDQERWFPDPRLHDDFQLPDVFYTRDDGAFDKGHIVRRDDVAWGEDYDTLRRANGDTYHVTNCSPQVLGFNQSSRGEDNWGDLENHVLKSATSERYCQFAGPILSKDDEVFVGAGGGRVRLRIKIPRRYWKVNVVATEEGLASFGFVLEQDLSNVPFEEFIVPENFERFMEPLTRIEEQAGIRFAAAVRSADQYETNEGLELAMRTGVRRRSGSGSEAVLQMW